MGWVSRTPFVFASLGPTAYEIVETSKRPSARAYNIIVENLIAVLAGFAALWMTDAWGAPKVSAHGAPWIEWAATIAALLTVLCTLLARAAQPASLPTTLLIALGIMQTARDGVIITLAVLLITAIGEPIRRWRVKDAPPQKS